MDPIFRHPQIFIEPKMKWRLSSNSLMLASWFIPVSLACGRWKQKNYDFKDSLDCTVSPKQLWLQCERLSQQNKTTLAESSIQLSLLSHLLWDLWVSHFLLAASKRQKCSWMNSPPRKAQRLYGHKLPFPEKETELVSFYKWGTSKSPLGRGMLNWRTVQTWLARGRICETLS